MFPDVKFLTLTLYEWCFLIGVLAALVVARVYADKLKISAKLQNFGIISAVVSILAGYGFAILFQAVYDFIETGTYTFDQTTGVTFYGGLIGGAAVFLLLWFTLVRKFCGKEAIDLFPKALGIGACSIAIAHSIGRVGCLMAGCCHGAVTDSWIGIWHPHLQAKVVPTQLLEAIFLLELFFLLTWLLFRTKVNGIAVYMVAYGVFRFVIEFERADPRGALIPGLSPSQVWSIVLFVIGAAYLIAAHIVRKKRGAH